MLRVRSHALIGPPWSRRVIGHLLLPWLLPLQLLFSRALAAGDESRCTCCAPAAGSASA